MQCVRNSAESGERSVLTRGSPCLPCVARRKEGYSIKLSKKTQLFNFPPLSAISQQRQVHTNLNNNLLKYLAIKRPVRKPKGFCFKVPLNWVPDPTCTGLRDFIHVLMEIVLIIKNYWKCGLEKMEFVTLKDIGIRRLFILVSSQCNFFLSLNFSCMAV